MTGFSMLRMAFYLLLSVALHLLCGQWLLAANPGLGRAPVAAPALAVQMLSWAAVAPTPMPAVLEQPAAAPVSAALKAARPAPKPASVARPRPAVAPALKAAPSTVARAAATASAPAPQDLEVVSLQPAFRSPPAPPRYPPMARRRNQQGLVLVEVRLSAAGEQRELKLLRSSGVDSLDRAALAAVAAWQFRPEVRDGQAVSSRVRIPIQFSLTARR